MPTYDYRCPAGHDFERFFRKFSDAAGELECPVCGAVAMRRVSGGAGLVFKGSGFYLTDYGKNAHRKPESDGASSDSKREAAAESKPETKADASKAGAGAAGGEKTETSTKGSTKESKEKHSEPTSSSPKPKGGDSK